MNKQRIEEKTGKQIKTFALIMSILILLILNTMFTSATVDLVVPDNNTHTNQQEITFEYYVSLDNLTECSLLIDSSIEETETNLTNHGFNEFTSNLDEGEHSWGVSCTNTNTTEESEIRSLTIDMIEPTIVLVSPNDGTQINQSSAELSFIVINSPEEESTCDVIVNDTIEKSVTAQDSETTTATVSSLDEGLYEWKITCYDQANNTETSNTRTFKINTTQPESEPEFSITIPKSNYELGENGLMTISATNGTSIVVEVCPDEPGFVECNIPVTGKNIMNYPFEEWLPFTRRVGSYILEANFNYSGHLETQTLNYNVLNNIVINIEYEGTPREKVPLIIEAHASGGVGALEYTWHLSNGSTTEGELVNITYQDSGTYTETVVVKDSYNNTLNKSIIIDVSDTFLVEFLVKDELTNKPISGASIQIQSDEKNTGSNGKAKFYLRKRNSDISAMQEGYEIYDDEIDITKAETITIILRPESSQKPVITLKSPADGSVITGTSTRINFRAEHENTLNCSVYINENNDGFFIYLGSLTPNKNKDTPYSIIDLENKTYWWKIECSDILDNTATSQTWEFTVGEGTAGENQAETLTANQATGETSNLGIYNERAKEFEIILDVLENLPEKEKEAAQLVGAISSVKEAISLLKNVVRDVDSINFINDLSESQKQAEKDKIIERAEEAYQKAPVDVELINSDTFVDYISDSELEEIFDEYLEINDMGEEVNKRKALAFLKELQQEIVISTKVRTARVSYKDGTQAEFTGVIKEIKTYNITEGAIILEVIPKEVAQTTDDVYSTQEYQVVKKDPIISFALKGDRTVMYFFENKIDTEKLRGIKTAVFLKPESLSDDMITGYATKGVSFKFPKIKGIIFIPILIIILGGLVFAGVKYDGINTAKYLIYKIHGRKSLHYLSVILNDIKDSLDTGDSEKALQLYEEAKDAYEDLSTIAKNDIYPQVAETAQIIGTYCKVTQKEDSLNDIKLMITNISSLLNNGDLENALEEYKRVETAYNHLGENTKEVIHPSLVALGNKIQIIIDRGKERGYDV